MTILNNGLSALNQAFFSEPIKKYDDSSIFGYIVGFR
jgi:hypothetical protein